MKRMRVPTAVLEVPGCFVDLLSETPPWRRLNDALLVPGSYFDWGSIEDISHHGMEKRGEIDFEACTSQTPNSHYPRKQGYLDTNDREGMAKNVRRLARRPKSPSAKRGVPAI